MERPYLLKTWHWVALLILQIILSASSLGHSHNIYYSAFVVITSAIIYYGFIRIIQVSCSYDHRLKKRKTK